MSKKFYHTQKFMIISKIKLKKKEKQLTEFQEFMVIVIILSQFYSNKKV